MNSSPPLSSQTLREIYVNVPASFLSLSLSSSTSITILKKKGKKRGDKKRGERKSGRETRVNPAERERNLKKVENRRTRGDDGYPHGLDGEAPRKGYLSSRDRRIFHPEIGSRPKSGQVQLLPRRKRERKRERTWRNGARPINPATLPLPQCQLNDNRSVPEHPKVRREEKEESWRGEERREKGHGSMGRKETRSGEEEEGAIAGRTDKAAVSNLVAPLYIQLGKAQTGMERG